MRCPNCGADNSDNATFCSLCQSSISLNHSIAKREEQPKGYKESKEKAEPNQEHEQILKSGFRLIQDERSAFFWSSVIGFIVQVIWMLLLMKSLDFQQMTVLRFLVINILFISTTSLVMSYTCYMLIKLIKKVHIVDFILLTLIAFVSLLTGVVISIIVWYFAGPSVFKSTNKKFRRFFQKRKWIKEEPLEESGSR